MNFTMYAKFARLVRAQGLEYAADYAKKLGFSSVEFFEFIGDTWEPVLKTREDAIRAKEVLAERSLTVACYSVAVNLYEEGMSADTVTHMEKQLMHYAELAAALGSPYLHHTLLLGLPHGVLTMEEALSLIVPVASRVARYAHSLGVTCIYEDQGAYFNGVEGFGRFYKAVKENCPYVGICGDIGNVLFADEEPLPFFKAYATEFKHVHVKDYIRSKTRGDGNGWDRSTGGVYLKECILGKGCIDIPACMNEVKKAGYRGAIALENNHEEDFELGTGIAMELVSSLLA